LRGCKKSHSGKYERRRQMERKGEKGEIIIHLNDKGEFNYVEINGKKIDKPTGNLAESRPTGVLKGIIDIGHILCFKQPDGTERYCVHRSDCSWYCPHP
jgi:hypothetical protein